MRTFLSAAAVAAAALGLSACGVFYDYDKLRALDPPPGKYQGALTREYTSFALFEEDEMYDHPDAAHFARKAERVAAGEAVAPERLADWRLPEAERPRLANARARLVEVLAAGAPGLEPEAAATALARFDCWVEQQEENWQWDDIAKCRDGFYAALTRLEADLVLPFGGVRGAPRPGLKPTAAMATVPGPNPDSRAFTLFFDFDSDRVAGESLLAIRNVVEAARGGSEVTVVLAGYADRAGPLPYNQGLSLRRAQAVKTALIQAGVPAGAITVTAFGESRPRVVTPDGVRERRNRRVEIVIADSPTL